MTIKEFIEKLQKFDENKKVLICGYDWTQEIEIDEDSDTIYIKQEGW